MSKKKIENCATGEWVYLENVDPLLPNGKAIILTQWAIHKCTEVEYDGGVRITIDWGTEVTPTTSPITNQNPNIYTKLKFLEHDLGKINLKRNSREFKEAYRNYIEASIELRKFF